MTQRLSVSVIIPVRDGAAFILEAIESSLRQNYPAAEVIVVDDGSSDNSAELARSRDVVVLQQPPSGVSHARNLGAARAKGELISFLDADDRMTPERLDLHESLLRTQPDIVGVTGSMVRFEVNRNESGNFEAFSQPEPGAVAGNLTTRRALYLEGGGQTTRPELAGTEFMEWFLRCQRAGLTVATIEEVTLERRVHDANWTRDSERLKRTYLALARDSVLAMRAKNQGQ